MSTPILDALSRLAAHRFGSFADAATDVLDLLESASPGGSLALGQVDWDEGSCRMIDRWSLPISASNLACLSARPSVSFTGCINFIKFSSLPKHSQ